MKILCTNDDGYLATGIGVLARAAEKLGTVTTVAPDREQSATSHSLTMDRPLRVTEIHPDLRIVNGTPTDCVTLATQDLFPGSFDLCLSGVNHGPNMGEDVFYSGTVAAAIESSIQGVPAIALSYADRTSADIEPWLDAILDVLRPLVEHMEAWRDGVLNVNIPPIPPAECAGVRFTRLGRRRFEGSIHRGRDPSGKPYHWIGGGTIHHETERGTDYAAITNGFISVTPLKVNLTAEDVVDVLDALPALDFSPRVGTRAVPGTAG